MYVNELTLRSNDGRFYIVPMPDMHADLDSFDEREFISWRNAVLELQSIYPVLVVGLGDYIHGRLPGNKFFNSAILRADVSRQLNNYVGFMVNRVGKLLKPLTDAGVRLVLLRGNHDAYIEHADVPLMIADYVGAEYANTEMLVRVRSVDRYDKSYVTNVYAAHGASGAGTPGAKLNKARGSLFVANADVYLYGHIHDAVTRVEAVPSLATHGKPRLVLKDRLFAYASSFVQSRAEDNFDYPNEKSLPVTNSGKYQFLIDPADSKIYDARMIL